MSTQVYQIMTYGLEIPECCYSRVFELQEHMVLGSELKEELREWGLGGVGLGGGENRLEARGQVQLKGLQYKETRTVWIRG